MFYGMNPYKEGERKEVFTVREELGSARSCTETHCNGGGGNIQSPIFRWHRDAPYVSGFVQCQAQQPELTAFHNRDAVHDSRRRTTGWKTFELHRGPDLYRTMESRRTPLRIYQDDCTLLRTREE